MCEKLIPETAMQVVQQPGVDGKSGFTKTSKSTELKVYIRKANKVYLGETGLIEAGPRQGPRKKNTGGEGTGA